jgi:glycosyltransferase involved in cell wall biosynthesis
MRQRTLTISVAMCTYNGEDYLQEQLDSILGQTLPPDELVVCDDGSSDRTDDILESFADRAPFSVRLYRNEVNLGSRQNFQQTIDHCNGSIVVLSDQDDVWHRDKLEQLSRILIADPECVGAFSNARLVDADGEPLDRTLWEHFEVGPDIRRILACPDEEAQRVLLRRNYVTGATFAFRADFWKEIKPIPRCWVHDAWIVFVLTSCGKVVGLDEMLVDYRQHLQNQIGIQQTTRKERALDQHALERVACRITGALNHIRTSGRSWSPRLTEELEARLTHISKRLSGRGRGIRSAYTLFPELLSGQYHQYSNGLLSFIKDMKRIS